jgi:hypothetical protein
MCEQAEFLCSLQPPATNKHHRTRRCPLTILVQGDFFIAELLLACICIANNVAGSWTRLQVFPLAPAVADRNLIFKTPIFTRLTWGTSRGTACRGTACRGTACRGTACRGTACRGTACRGTACRGTARRGTASLKRRIAY